MGFESPSLEGEPVVAEMIRSEEATLSGFESNEKARNAKEVFELVTRILEKEM